MGQIAINWSETGVAPDDGYHYLGLDAILAPNNDALIHSSSSSEFVLNVFIASSSLYYGHFFTFTPATTFTYNGALPTGVVESITLTNFNDATYWTIEGLSSLNLTVEQIIENPALAFAGDDTFTVSDTGSRVVIYAGDGYDIVTTPHNHDVIDLGRGDGIVDGNGGVDRVIADLSDRSAPVTYTHNDTEATLYVGGVASIILRNIEYIDITGGSGYDIIVGGSGSDIIRLGAGGGDADGGSAIDTIVLDFSHEVGDATFVFDPSLATAFVGSTAYAVARNFEISHIVSGDGDDHFVGGDGNDRFDSGFGDDYVDGAGGENTLYVSDGAAFIVDLATTDPQNTGRGVDTILNIQHLEGGTGADQFFGNAQDNHLYGFDGDDVLSGGAGNDVLRGGRGEDTISGGEGDDRISGAPDGTIFTGFDPNAAPNALSGDAGDDIIFGDNGADIIDGGDGYDQLFGLGGANVIHGGNDWDDIFGGADAELLYGDGGNDRITSGGGGDYIYGGDGNDVLSIGSVNLYDPALILDMYLDGGAGDDTLTGFYGNDILVGGDGRDSMSGSLGFDTADYSSAPSRVVVSLDVPQDYIGDSSYQDTLGAGIDRLLSIEAVIGSNFDDELTASNFEGSLLDGGDGNDTLIGKSRADQLYGGDGNDTLSGGDGGDLLVGGDGIDVVAYNRGNVGIEVNLALNRGRGGEAEGDVFYGIENIVGTNFNDRLTGAADNNFLYGLTGDDMMWGNEGDDILIGGAGADILTGGAGVDATSYHNSSSGVRIVLFQHIGRYGEAEGDQFGSIENIIGSPFQDEIFGDNANNELYGQEDVDVLEGDAGDDYLDGGAGADKIYGQDGNDTLYGGEGQDRLFGGGGADRFFYRDVSESLVGTPDEIVEFTRAHGDKIDLSGIDANTNVGGDQAFSFIGAAAFSSTAGELRYAGNFLEADVNGDGAADFQVQLNVASLQSDDFYL